MLFIVHHIDSVIQIFLGVVFSWIAYRRPGRLVGVARKVLRVAGPALIVIGGLLLLEPHPEAKWRVQTTADLVASAEFPGAPTAAESDDTNGAVTVRRTSFSYSVPGKDIALFLSSSAMPENTRAMTDSQRIEATVSWLTAQGSRTIQNDTDATGTIHRLTLRSDDKKTTMQVALAYVGGVVYRVVASWSDGQEDKPLTDRFIGSFRIAPVKRDASH